MIFCLSALWVAFLPEKTSPPAVSRPSGRLAGWLATAPKPAFTLFAMTAAFSTYFCMYAFRKPFAAADFKDLHSAWFGEMQLKSLLVISQTIGYAISKFLGIKLCSEAQPHRRSQALVGLIVFAELALVAFGLLPVETKFLALFANGLALGMVWGLVVWYLEGRQTSELLLAGLSCSFIIASGITKDVGSALMSPPDWASGFLGSGISEMWMPAATGVVFLPMYLFSVWCLGQLPKPSSEDESARSVREVMNSAHRLAFVKQFFWGLLMLTVTYFFLTAYRDFRDNFQRQLFEALNYPYDSNKLIVSRSEMIVAFVVTGTLALLNMIKDNRRGLMGAYAIMTGGLVLMGAATYLHRAGMISGFWWMTLVGTGAYLAYVPYGSVLFDRLIASTRVVGTAVFAIYVADALGYTGSVGVLLFKEFGQKDISYLAFFEQFTIYLSIFGTVFLIGSCIYFLTRHRHAEG